MAILVERMLQLADEMITGYPTSSAAKRRAVSTAYYAAFHALAKTCAETLLGEDAETTAYERVYRALDHGSLKNAFQQSDSPLKRREDLKRLGDIIVPLQTARMIADYAPPKVELYEANVAPDRVNEARRFIDLIGHLSLTDRQTLATHLLFQVRKK